MNKMIFLPAVLVVLVDWLLIRGTDKLIGSKHSQIRAWLAASLGGIQTVLCLLPGFSFLNDGPWRVILLATAGLIAFEINVGHAALYCLLNMGLGGMFQCLSRGNVVDIAVSVVLIIALCFLSFRNKPGNEMYIPIEIPTSDGSVSMTALVDTGNSLTDPITGCPVLVVSSHKGCQLLGVEPEFFKNPTASVMHYPGLRLVPYNTVGGRGLLVAKKFNDVLVGNKKRNILVAFSPMEIGKGKCFNALTGGVLS